MRSILLPIFFLVTVSLLAQESPFLRNEVLVMLDNKESVNQFVESLNKEYSSLNIYNKQTISKKMNIHRIGFDNTKVNEHDFLRLIELHPNVLITQFNHTNISTRDTCPNDPEFSLKQWSLKNTGQTGGMVGADIDACKAWDYLPADSIADTTIYGDKIVIANVEDGFDLDHPDLNFFINEAEIPGDSIDNDGNGFIDDVQGWNFYWDSNVIYQAAHGTHTSGIMGAKGNNSMGIAGVAPGITILPVQGSSTLESYVVQCYDYILTMRDLYDSTNGAKGAFIVATNASFGVDNANPSSYPLWCAMYDSLGKRGILTAAATSNSNSNVDMVGDMPTTCISPYVIGVTNTNANDTKATAGYGATHIDLGAPGQGIYSTISNGNYGTQSGTSMAAPHVTGSIGFIFAVACTNFIQTYKNTPDSVALIIKQAILGKTDPNGALNGITVSGGRLNLFNTVEELHYYGLCSTTSIREKNAIEQIKMYPNPNKGIFNVDVGDNNEINHLIVYNSMGKIIMNKSLNYTSNRSIEIDLTNQVSAGMYFLCLKSYTGNHFITKFSIE